MDNRINNLHLKLNQINISGIHDSRIYAIEIENILYQFGVDFIWKLTNRNQSLDYHRTIRSLKLEI